jgi:regulator of sigma E protease
MVVSRGTDGAETTQRTIQLAPTPPITFSMLLPPGVPMPVPAAGFAYRVENEVVGVVDGSPAASTDIAPGDRITAVEIIPPQDAETEAGDRKIEFSAANPNWPAFIDGLQFLPAGTEFDFAIQRGDATPHRVRLKTAPADGLFVTARGFIFEPIERTRRAATFSEQIREGWDETTEALTMVFRFLRKLGTQVPINALGGPVMIAKAAGYSASEGLSSLLIFLTMLSANLAVINFLPIPLLDGGHIVFLAYEGIRGRPANEKFVVALHTAGFVFIVSLMLYVLALDLEFIPRNL